MPINGYRNRLKPIGLHPWAKIRFLISTQKEKRTGTAEEADWRQRAEVIILRLMRARLSPPIQEKKVTVRDAIFHKIKDFGKRRQNTLATHNALLICYANQ
ncbi:hypothetical protein IJS77_04555 [bacterium]|nr:hypothetical protein [bacterium]